MEPIFIGPPLLACDKKGHVLSRVGTVFLRTPGIVTTPGVIHFMQRAEWVEHLATVYDGKKLPRLSEADEVLEMERSADLLMDDQYVYIRPDPQHLELSWQADKFLQTLIPKYRIRYLNINIDKVRRHLRERGELWRIAPLPATDDDMIRMIEQSRITLSSGRPFYYYNQAMGTRYVTAEAFARLADLPDAELRAQLKELQGLMRKRNRLHNNEACFFPANTAFNISSFHSTSLDEISDEQLRVRFLNWVEEYRRQTPPELRHDDITNLNWRNAMCDALAIRPNSSISTDDVVISSLSPEFYRKIRWLPGATFHENRLSFDPVFEEEKSPEQALRNARARGIIYNYARELRGIKFINIGHVGETLSITRGLNTKKHSVYLLEIETMPWSPLPGPNPHRALRVVRFLKWGTADHLDEGKDFMPAVYESADYTDYVFDRRLACLQFGMNLPANIWAHYLCERYHGANQKESDRKYWAVYLERDYIEGYATDKIPHHYYESDIFNCELARLLGQAAAINIVVGRASDAPRTEQEKRAHPQRPFFDDGDEIIQVDDEKGIPVSLIIADPTGSFAHYATPFDTVAPAYAQPVNRRIHLLSNPAEFSAIYLGSMKRHLHDIQLKYNKNRTSFDNLFSHLPIDNNGNIRYRWETILKRLRETNLNALMQHISAAIKPIP